MDKRIKDITGQRFGRLIVLEHCEERRSYRSSMWKTQCDCGANKLFTRASLVQAGVKSCGCLMRENVAAASRRRTRHGQSKRGEMTGAYRSWHAIQQRCYNPNNPKYHRYGGRGIKVIWNSFDEFYRDMGDRPAKKSIERIDVNGNYEKGNCKWGTDREQGRNKTNHRYITLNGITRCTAEWAEINNIPYGAIRNRLHKGWDELRAITEPIRK